jgi:uncharacterized membrane protein YphA (DoxX/SURF4 family)
MQRLFSMFPAGLPGIGLALLRASVTIALLLEHHSYRPVLSACSEGTAILLSLALIVGFLTPIAAALAMVFHVLIWITLAAEGIGPASVITLEALALILIGPGAYSLDSYRFGRRMLVLPPE